jgi:hypothetical protein
VDDDAYTIRDADGTEWRAVAVGPSVGFSVDRDGTVHHWQEHADGRREEWTEPLSASPVKDVFAPWVWDLVFERRWRLLIRRAAAALRRGARRLRRVTG